MSTGLARDPQGKTELPVSWSLERELLIQNLKKRAALCQGRACLPGVSSILSGKGEAEMEELYLGSIRALLFSGHIFLCLTFFLR